MFSMDDFYKSGEVEEDGWNLMSSGGRSNHGWRSQSSVCWVGATALCLGLLLLTVIMVAHNTSAINQWDSKYTDLIHVLTKGRDELRDERDQLKIQSSNLTQELEALRSQYNDVVDSRDKLQEDIKNLHRNRTGARKDCQQKGADLVIITTRDEMDFVKSSFAITWIGLSRHEHEDKWKWVDGTFLDGDGFWQDGEPNNSDGEEDCVELSRSATAWNDVHCNQKFSWVCED
ncbi:C-type lectin domain family 4 member M isoform X2 [Sparus aurata]|uniref:C-type lectin domain family 4 member M isoform X2 n=1 Tax=Sparus aurata TaxID=8175 RepID=UPI0011C13191|nr:C-type lectin domain family 4 member M-like isoform X2 [Sparus aurata]